MSQVTDPTLKLERKVPVAWRPVTFPVILSLSPSDSVIEIENLPWPLMVAAGIT